MTNYLSSSEVYKEIRIIQDEALKKFSFRQNLLKQLGEQLDMYIRPPHTTTLISNDDMYIYIYIDSVLR